MRKTFETERFMFDFFEQWSQFFEPCNWYTFQPVMIEVEDTRHFGDFEATVVLLGFGLRFVWSYNPDAEDKQMLREKMAALDLGDDG